ncbi:hypothetical protein C8J57DRAFT_572629 [Mycena rebaudengoi]|nr:hypothetical protein C8J57DRAFT_572629 [Mycena rebaudengoi]
MQAASHGARHIARKAPKDARQIHIPTGLRPQTTSLGQRLINQSRLALNRFVTHLTTPGTGAVSAARSFHANPSIQQRLSFTARTTLGRPLQPRFLPHGPTLPRTMTQVGLGTARNFSSGRPIFQQLADNIPVAGRAFYEADWELNMQKERENMRRFPKKSAAPKAVSKQTLKANSAKFTAPVTEASVPTSAELEHYFAAPSVPNVTTNLLIPLAPTPTARAPLAEFPSPRLPLPALLAIHDAHETHSLRVASLFQRLDAADVWSRGVMCAAYASSADAQGVCTILKVEFVGWSKAAVRGVIGESGTGWCVLEERRTDDEFDADEDALSETSSILSGIMDEEQHLPSPPSVHIDPAQSFVLPTLDFSSTFLASAQVSPAASERFSSPAPSEHFSHYGRDLFSHSNSSGSDVGSWDDDSFSSASSVAFVDPPSENGYFGFSSDFARRANLAPEPRESLFA